MAGVTRNASMETQVCIELPPNVHSQGIIAALHKHGPGMNFSLPILETQIVLIFAFTQTFNFVLKKFGIPKFTSEMLAGIVLGPTLIGASKAFKKDIFPDDSQAILDLLGEIGYELFLFLIGVRMDLELIQKSGRKVLFTGTLCLLAPLITGLILQKQLMSMTSLFKLTKDQSSKLPYATTSYCMTSSPVIVLLLEEMNLLTSEIGRLAVAASSISELGGILVVWFSSVLVRMSKVKPLHEVLIILGVVIVGALAFLFTFRPVMYWIIRQTPQNKPVKKGYVSAIIMVMFGVMFLSHYYGHTFHFMVFVLGLAIPAGQPLGSAIEELLHGFVYLVLLPIYVTSKTMKADFRLVDFGDPATIITAILFVTIFVAKLIGTMAAPLYYKMPWKDTIVLALILSTKGIVQVSFYNRFHEDQTLSDSIFGLTLVCILLTATLVPLLVNWLYDPAKRYTAYETRDIMHLKPNAELKILACIHRSGNIPAVINLLDAACPSTKNPIDIYVLHLMELIGRSSPVFISHQMQQKKSISAAYSDNVVLYFNEFVRENLGAVTLNIFTSISRHKDMQEDICTLAMDKMTSLIVLPFHRKWAIDGSVESDDGPLRTLNRNVLERAPCSVGVLVDCGHLGRSTSTNITSRDTRRPFSVAMVFFGGADDREALTFAKRMAGDAVIRLSVIHVAAAKGNNVSGGEWDRILDTEMLKEFKRGEKGEEYVRFVEEVVNDGPETTVVLKAIVDEHDLIIVGRRFKVECAQTSGLNEWSEFPELGTVADLLISSDFNCRASVLVVKHQRQII